MAGNIFISYRRNQDAHFAGRLYDQLLRSFPNERLFLDVDDIEPGLDFAEVLESRVAKCDVLLAVIGAGWLEVEDEETGARRIENPDDYVRIEIESALRRDVRVIPVLVDGASVPDPDSLPEPLKPLARRQAIRLDYDRFSSDIGRLIRGIEIALAAVEETRAVTPGAVPVDTPGATRLQIRAPVRDARAALTAVSALDPRIKWGAAALFLLALLSGSYYLGSGRTDALLEDEAAQYVNSGNFACFADAAFPDSWRNEAASCTNYGCNFGKLDRISCLLLGARKGSQTVIHGNTGGGRSNECWLQEHCGDLKPHADFTYFSR